MNPYGFALFVHVTAAIVLVGWSAAAHLTVALIPRAGTVDGIRSHVRWLAAMARTSGPLAGVVLLAGLYLTFAGDWWGRGWPVVSLVLFAVAGTLASTVVDPAVRRLAQRADDLPDGPVTPAVLAVLADPMLTRVTWLLAGADLAIVFLMTNKPGWTVSLVAAALGLTAGAALGERDLRRARRHVGPATPAEAGA